MHNPNESSNIELGRKCFFESNVILSKVRKTTVRVSYVETVQLESIMVL